MCLQKATDAFRFLISVFKSFIFTYKSGNMPDNMQSVAEKIIDINFNKIFNKFPHLIDEDLLCTFINPINHCEMIFDRFFKFQGFLREICIL